MIPKELFIDLHVQILGNMLGSMPTILNLHVKLCSNLVDRGTYQMLLVLKVGYVYGS